MTINSRYIPTKLINLIEETISNDQGASYRGNLGKVIAHIGDAYSTDTTPFRSHLGASILGGECYRRTWYSWRWFTRPKFDARMLRLFNTGHLAEAKFIAILLTAGCQLFQQDKDGKQFRIGFANGHGGGSSDGIVYNIPDAPNQYMLCEFKTHSEKSFEKLKADGVAIAKPEHHVQMNIYMEKMAIPMCLYGAVNKNTDEIYWEIIVADKEKADAYLKLAEDLVQAEKPPTKLSTSPGYWKCRFCEQKNICHLNAVPDNNCRTCRFSKAIDNGEWLCGYTGEILTKEKQLIGCNAHNSDWN